MGCSSTLTIYRKYNIDVLDENKLNKIKNNYIESNDGKEKDAFPIIIDSNFKAHQFSEEPKTVAEFRNRYFTIDGNPVDELVSTFFISNYNELWSEFNLQGYGFGRSEYQISLEEAKNIVVAIKYLLGGEYSKKMEDILNNKWVRIFGNGYSKYSIFHSASNKKIYIERECNDLWTINIGNDIEDNENDLEQESNMISTLLIMETFINLCNEYHEKYIDYILVYSVSC